jgi:hypothetical protein
MNEPKVYELDGSRVYVIDDTPVKELTDQELKAAARILAEQSPGLIDAQNKALAALVRNEQLLGVVTHELNRRRTSIALAN